MLLVGGGRGVDLRGLCESSLARLQSSGAAASAGRGLELCVQHPIDAAPRAFLPPDLVCQPLPAPEGPAQPTRRGASTGQVAIRISSMVNLCSRVGRGQGVLKPLNPKCLQPWPVRRAHRVVVLPHLHRDNAGVPLVCLRPLAARHTHAHDKKPPKNSITPWFAPLRSRQGRYAGRGGRSA
jgi:hypothetical protein